MAKVNNEPHEAYETKFRYDVVDFISHADGGPLCAQETSDDGNDLSTPPAGTAIWQEWHAETDPERRQLMDEIERVTLRPLARRAFQLVGNEDS